MGRRDRNNIKHNKIVKVCLKKVNEIEEKKVMCRVRV